MSKAKKQMSDGSNIVAVLLLNVAMFSLVFPSAATAPPWAIASVAAAAAFIGTLLRFQVVFEGWTVPRVSFSMKQVGLRGKRHERSS